MLTLDIKGYKGENAKLRFFFASVVRSSDVLQYVFGKLLGKRPIARNISPNKTLEGFIGGTLAATGRRGTLVGDSVLGPSPHSAWRWRLP